LSSNQENNECGVDGSTRTSALLRDIPRRVDGVALLGSIVVTVAAALAPLLGFGLGKSKVGAVAYPFLMFVPTLFVLYGSLVCFSSGSIVSRVFNSIILFALPVYLIIMFGGRV
jgi:hypothetical protein